MRFGDALELMKRGKAIRRPTWGSHYLQFSSAGIIRRWGGGFVVTKTLRASDLLADDWELLNRPLSAREGEPLCGIQNRTLAEVDGVEAA